MCTPETASRLQDTSSRLKTHDLGTRTYVTLRAANQGTVGVDGIHFRRCTAHPDQGAAERQATSAPVNSPPHHGRQGQRAGVQAKV